jgi:hypothetical protein
MNDPQCPPQQPECVGCGEPWEEAAVRDIVDHDSDHDFYYTTNEHGRIVRIESCPCCAI